MPLFALVSLSLVLKGVARGKKKNVFESNNVSRWSPKRPWYLTASGQDPGISPRYGKTKLSRSLF